MGAQNKPENIATLLQDVTLDILFGLMDVVVTPDATTPLPPGADMHRLWPRNSSLPANTPVRLPSVLSTTALLASTCIETQVIEISSSLVHCC